MTDLIQIAAVLFFGAALLLAGGIIGWTIANGDAPDDDAFDEDIVHDPYEYDGPAHKDEWYDDVDNEWGDGWEHDPLDDDYDDND